MDNKEINKGMLYCGRRNTETDKGFHRDVGLLSVCSLLELLSGLVAACSLKNDIFLLTLPLDYLQALNSVSKNLVLMCS